MNWLNNILLLQSQDGFSAGELKLGALTGSPMGFT